MKNILLLEKRKQKEIARLEKEKSKSKPLSYLFYMLFIVTIVYIADEICTQIGTQMQTILATKLFYNYDNPSTAMANFGYITIIVSGLAILYKPLSDKYGRKIFLVINTLGMGLAMLFIGIATNIPVYIIGTCFIAFFTPHDMQAVYIYESAPAKHRAKFYSISKFFATLGMLLIGFLRTIFMKNGTEGEGWRYVYIIPGSLALLTSLFALLFVKESDAYIETKLKLLKMTKEEIEEEKKQNIDNHTQGGLISALKYIFRHKQVLWCVLVFGFINMATIFTGHYEEIINIGISIKNNLLEPSMANFTDLLKIARESDITTNYCNKVILIFPVGSAIVQLIQGFICDKSGRKIGTLIMAIFTLITFMLFYVGTNLVSIPWNPWLIGLFVGACVGSFWAVGDIVYLLVEESTPTNLRASVIGVIPLLSGAFYLVGMGIYAILNNILGDVYIGLVNLILTAPFLVISIIILLLKVKETNGVDLGSIKGNEFE